ncbi:MAG TPA: hypothetical protein DCW90_23505 [Lachnospiraceae bacterium]|nr:hypothetical protein [Lachnospiraceae bacterium]
MNKLSEEDLSCIIDALERPYSIETIAVQYALMELCFENPSEYFYKSYKNHFDLFEPEAQNFFDSVCKELIEKEN